jgi:hypothetical protein
VPDLRSPRNGTGLLPLTQHAMRFSGCLSYHDYEGVALDSDEQQRTDPAILAPTTR